MKKHLLFSVIILQSLLGFAQSTNTDPAKESLCGNKLQQLMDQYTSAGIPGIAIAVYHPTAGYWTGASGYASIENKTAMLPSHLQYAQSVSKTYTAVILLQMQERGVINLDSPASNYLPAWVKEKIPYTREFTVRMLLNHSTGLPDYSSDKIYVLDLLQHPEKKFTIRDFVDYIADKKRLFAPGTDYSYCNMNTELAALIADHVSGDHARYMQEHIFQTLSLEHSFYRTAGYLDAPELVSSYWDRYSDGIFENVTQMQRTNVSNMMGDDGLVATPLDYINFLKGLFEERLINKSSLDQMMAGVKGKDGKLHGGLGLFKFSMGGLDGYGHGGAGIGAGCLLLYIPAKQTYIFLGTNMGTITEGPYSQKADQFKNELLGLVVR
jgi:D-alanyl-D-alanine carboxypeptidase